MVFLQRLAASSLVSSQILAVALGTNRTKTNLWKFEDFVEEAHGFPLDDIAVDSWWGNSTNKNCLGETMKLLLWKLLRVTLNLP